MHIIQDNQLSDFVEELRELWPMSLPILKPAENILRENTFAWPGIEFVVDRFPHFQACIIRPKPGASNYVPRRNHYVYNGIARCPSAFRALLEEPEVIDWKNGAYFQALPENLLNVLTEVCRRHGKAFGPLEHSDFASGGYIIKTNQYKPGKPVPDGFSVQRLRREDMETVSRLWKFGGGTKHTLKYLTYLNDQGFPAMAMYNPNGELVGFVTVSSDMSIAAAYIHPEYRNRGFLQMMTYRCCQELYKHGIHEVYALIADTNTASIASFLRAGAEMLPDWNVIWVLYLPDGVREDDALLEWYTNVYPRQ